MHLNTSPTSFEAGKREKKTRNQKKLKLAPKKQLGIYIYIYIYKEFAKENILLILTPQRAAAEGCSLLFCPSHWNRFLLTFLIYSLLMGLNVNSV